MSRLRILLNTYYLNELMVLEYIQPPGVRTQHRCSPRGCLPQLLSRLQASLYDVSNSSIPGHEPQGLLPLTSTACRTDGQMEPPPALLVSVTLYMLFLQGVGAGTQGPTHASSTTELCPQPILSRLTTVSTPVSRLFGCHLLGRLSPRSPRITTSSHVSALTSLSCPRDRFSVCQTKLRAS